MGLVTLLLTMFGTAFVTLSLMFLPAVIELAYPKDAGPRLISDSMGVVNVLPVVNIEGSYRRDVGLSLQVLKMLPNME
jgi:hypothetical protein